MYVCMYVYQRGAGGKRKRNFLSLGGFSTQSSLVLNFSKAISLAFTCIYVCMYVRMYVCTYVCLCMNVCMHICVLCMQRYIHSYIQNLFIRISYTIHTYINVVLVTYIRTYILLVSHLLCLGWIILGLLYPLFFLLHVAALLVVLYEYVCM